MKTTPKHIALIAGGYSGELEVSKQSQDSIYQFLSNTPYVVHKVLITKESWKVLLPDDSWTDIDKNDFSFITLQGSRQTFDYAYITIHGTPGENGLLTGYLEMLNIPYSCCSTLVSALTFDKFVCNKYLSAFGIKVTKGVRVFHNNLTQLEELSQTLNYPVFVKPCNGGSSLSTHKVLLAKDLQRAVTDALSVDGQVIIEEFIEGTEVTCGCYQDASGIHLLPITEVVTHNEFFDFNAKYNGEVEEITPARIPKELTQKVHDITRQVYRLLNARGIIRIDFIIKDEIPYLLEVNTTPGMTATSFIPQQVQACGQSMKNVLCSIIDFHLSTL